MKTLEPPTELTRACASNSPTSNPLTLSPTTLSPMTPLPPVPWADTMPPPRARRMPEIGLPSPKSKLERALTHMLALAADGPRPHDA